MRFHEWKKVKGVGRKEAIDYLRVGNEESKETDEQVSGGTARSAKKDVREVMKRSYKSGTNAGICAHIDGTMDVEGMSGFGIGKEEVEKAGNERWDEEVTIVGVRIGSGKLVQGNVKESTRGKGLVVKTENVVEDAVDMYCIVCIRRSA